MGPREQAGGGNGPASLTGPPDPSVRRRRSVSCPETGTPATRTSRAPDRRERASISPPPADEPGSGPPGLTAAEIEAVRACLVSVNPEAAGSSPVAPVNRNPAHQAGF